MGQKLFFSVVIPTLNEEKYLPTILKSLGCQTYHSFEVIIVDGNSSDNTRTVYEKYKKGLPLSSFILSDKANVGYQRNKGAKSAKGEYLVFLDADVNIDKTFLEELHIWAIKKKIKMATTWVKPDSKKTADKVMMLLANLLNEIVNELNKPYTGGYNTIIRKDFFLLLKGFREDLKINEDVDLALRAYKKGVKCVLLKEPLVTFSLRRFRSKGVLPVLGKLAKGNLLFFTKLYKKVDLFDYPMGGHVHNVKKKKKVNLTKLKTYINGMEKLGQKIGELLSE